MRNQKLDPGYYETLYNLPTSSPVPSGYIDWKSVAIYSGIAIGATIVFAVVIHQSQKSLNHQWLIVTENMNKKHQETQEHCNQLLLTVSSEIKQQRDMNQLLLQAKREETVDNSETNKSNTHEES